MSEDNTTGRSQDDETGTRSRTLIAAGIIVLLVVVGFVLARKLWSSAKLQNCLMSGRTNCAPIDTGR